MARPTLGNSLFAWEDLVLDETKISLLNKLPRELFVADLPRVLEIIKTSKEDILCFLSFHRQVEREEAKKNTAVSRINASFVFWAVLFSCSVQNIPCYSLDGRERLSFFRGNRFYGVAIRNPGDGFGKETKQELETHFGAGRAR
ncbi:MAG: uncharacterized protein A8A55_0161 [Amphiamblys sp. WSBS2006]|nr:MAG: uncharacterized protein A8A55_0173 [Amphiamblys sp. WSBS2006]OIR59036.1 MAG: uncharacterized protein A8A55_0161 [Amphiamblys sp. WSBS2006]